MSSDQASAEGQDGARRGRPGEVAFGLYALVVITICFALTLAILTLTPGLDRRRRIVKRGARVAFALAGIPLRTQGFDLIGAPSCVVVANHASYLDGIILAAALPPTFSFVIKREVTRVPLLHLLLRRIGSEFVERFDTRKSARDARRLLRAAATGRALAFFPEGTFRAEPGLRRFHVGAFVAAARADLPVVPVVIKGSRDILPAEVWLPRRGSIEVIVGAPLAGVGPPAARAGMLRAESRRAILEVLDEPDLTSA